MDVGKFGQTADRLFNTVQKAAVSPAETVDALSNKVIALTRRFYPSDVALPLRKCSSIRIP